MTLRMRRTQKPGPLDMTEPGIGAVITGRVVGPLREFSQEGATAGIFTVLFLIEQDSEDRLEIWVKDAELAEQFEAANPAPGDLLELRERWFLNFDLTVLERAGPIGFKIEQVWSEVEDEEEEERGEDASACGIQDDEDHLDEEIE